MKMLRINSLKQWREEYVELMVKADFTPYNNAPFKVAFHFPLGLPNVNNCRFSAGTLFNPPLGDMFGLAINETGIIYEEQRGRQVPYRRGEALLTSFTEHSQRSTPNNVGAIGITIPRAEFENRGVRPDDMVMRCLKPQQRESLRLLRRYIHLLENSNLDNVAPFGAPTALREICLRHIYDLVALAVSWRGAVGESDLGAVADTRLRSALDYIAANFNNPGLNVEMVARQQGISARYLQRLMKNAGQSYTSVVNEMRLQKAFSELSASRNGRSILEIAMRAGFSDLSYFHRLFRARFDDTPGGVAADASKQAP